MIREAVILAAGIGSRLGSIGNGAKFTLTIAGRPLITYSIFSLASTGVRKFIIVTRSETLGLLENALLNVDHGLEIEFCVNDDWERENGYSLYVASKCVRDKYFYLSMSDHIYPKEIPERLALESKRHPDAVAIVAGDRDPVFVDVEEATLIKTFGGKIIAIGKGLHAWDFVDTGVFVMRREIFNIASLLAKKKYKIKLSEIIQTAARVGYEVRVADVTGIPWAEVDTVEDYVSIVSGYKAHLPEMVSKSWKVYPVITSNVRELERL